MIKLCYKETKVIANETIIDEKVFEARIMFSKINEFEEKINKDCEEKESLMEKVVGAYTKGDINFLLETLNHFQTSKEKLSKEEISTFIDEYLINEEKDIYDVYEKVVNEFDISGVIKKGMGKNIVKQFTEAMSQAMEQMQDTQAMKEKMKN